MFNSKPLPRYSQNDCWFPFQCAHFTVRLPSEMRHWVAAAANNDNSQCVCLCVWMYRAAEINTGCKSVTLIKSFVRRCSDTWSVTGAPFRLLSRARRRSPAPSAVRKAVRHQLTDKRILSREPRLLLFVLAPIRVLYPLAIWCVGQNQFNFCCVDACRGLSRFFFFPPLGRKKGWELGLRKGEGALKPSSAGNSSWTV